MFGKTFTHNQDSHLDVASFDSSNDNLGLSSTSKPHFSQSEQVMTSSDAKIPPPSVLYQIL